MIRLLSTLVALAVIGTSIVATAQEFPQQDFRAQPPAVQPLHQHGQLYGHDYWHDDVHVPNVAQLDAYSDQLAKVARHLHEDAHQLSQDYEHSAGIEHYVDSVDRLQQHMHEILHQTAASGYQSSTVIAHVKSDVRQVKSLLVRLYGELDHQGVDGARTQDFHLIAHMKQMIQAEAFPLIRKTEVELYGYALDDHRHSSHRYPVQTNRWNWSRSYLHR